jgi:MoxR-like ATPase
LVLLETQESERAEVLLEHLATRMSLPLFDWLPHQGLMRRGETGPVYGTEKLRAALQYITGNSLEAVYHFRLVDDQLSEPIVVSQLAAAERLLRAHRGAIVITGKDVELPQALEVLFARVKLRKPTLEEYYEYVRELLADVRSRSPVSVNMDSQTVSELLTHLNGLLLSEVRRILTSAMVMDQSLGPQTIQRVIQEKQRLVGQGGVLEYYPAKVELGAIAGLTALKQWLAARAVVFRDSARAAQFGLSAPRGVLLLGVQGCGKSLAAKAVAAGWQLPLLRLDPARLYDKYVGETERNLRTAIETAERLAPVVLWIDEIEKALAVTDNDGGASTRLLGTFLTWLQEKQASVFVVATANDVTRLPAELLRKGRFDELFFVDLPRAEARIQILRVHLQSRGRNPDLYDLTSLAALAEGYSGAELEQAVVAALYDAFQAGEELEDVHIARALHAAVPLSVTMSEKVQALRNWAQGRTVPAD